MDKFDSEASCCQKDRFSSNQEKTQTFKCFIYFAGLLLQVSSISSSTNGTLCYNCRDVSHPRDCFRLTRCGQHEVCSVDRFSSDDGIITYDSGCKSKTFCSGFQTKREQESSRPTHFPQYAWDAQQYPICSTCCDADFCNLNLCDPSVDHTSKDLKRCLHCTGIEDPNNCETVTTCTVDEACYTQKQLNVNGEIRYNLGCRHQAVCDAAATSSMLVGRNVRGSDFCLGCCNTTNCNGKLCHEDPAVTTLPTTTPIPDRCTEGPQCHYLTSTFNLCEDPTSSRHICPVSCEVCTPRTPAPTPVCEDSPECGVLSLHFASIMCNEEKTHGIMSSDMSVLWTVGTNHSNSIYHSNYHYHFNYHSDYHSDHHSNYHCNYHSNDYYGLLHGLHR
ncbi:uncharacterized protein LOC117315099 [Pecten maximus]|uniref:uncharacterized protein LOC117315099 n=1 Tax=Pecten maximus TaxID=6579 RepID=UPI0014583E2F|nr:uncharacterized protein LOC117315099 [Pecten maximus]